jgi:23S rRNA (cytosine1962-C5)-methyltransferase
LRSSDDINPPAPALRPGLPGLRLRVTAAAETAVRGGHPWVFAGSIREQNRPGETGELAAIYDRKDRFLAIGWYDAESPIRLRVLHIGKPVQLDAAWWRGRLAQSLARRTGLVSEQTDGLRLIHGESDGWPGLVLDRYGEVLVLKLYSAAWFPHLTQVTGLLMDALRPASLLLRLSRNIQPAARARSLEDGQLLAGHEVSGPVTFRENGLSFEADALRGQKTGFFLDQRENRALVGGLAAGRDVLNAFSFSGGFSLYAARGGAKSVTDLDISPHALAAARRNFALNQTEANVARCRHETVQANAFEWLAGNTTREFDLIVLDPPSLARREAERAGAIRAYQSLARMALGHLRPEGWLVACSCSAHVSAEEFFQAVRTAAHGLEEWRTTGHPSDHPAGFPEARYLKAIYLRRRS